MWPFHVSMGPLAISPNEVFAVLGAVVCGYIVRRRLIALGSSPGGVLDFILAALGAGAVGARLYYFLPLWFRGQMSLGQLFSTWSQGSGFYGAYVGGVLGLAVTAWFTVTVRVSVAVTHSFTVYVYGTWLVTVWYSVIDRFWVVVTGTLTLYVYVSVRGTVVIRVTGTSRVRISER